MRCSLRSISASGCRFRGAIVFFKGNQCEYEIGEYVWKMEKDDSKKMMETQDTYKTRAVVSINDVYVLNVYIGSPMSLVSCFKLWTKQLTD